MWKTINKSTLFQPKIFLSTTKMSLYWPYYKWTYYLRSIITITSTLRLYITITNTITWLSITITNTITCTSIYYYYYLEACNLLTITPCQINSTCVQLGNAGIPNYDSPIYISASITKHVIYTITITPCQINSTCVQLGNAGIPNYDSPIYISTHLLPYWSICHHKTPNM